MVIQRIQSLLLLLAAVLVCLFCFVVPVAYADGGAIKVTDNYTMLIINSLIAALLLIDIFLFKNLKLQMRVALISLLLMAASIGITAFVLTCRMPAGAEAAWALAFAFVLGAFLLTYAAYRRMQADYKLLRSYDRLR